MTHNTSSHNKTVQKHLPALSTHLVFFILMWVFFAGYYGDILYIAQQYSFFTTDLQVMETVWNHSYAILWMIGRALLQLCYYPLFQTADIGLRYVHHIRYFLLSALRFAE